MAQNNNNNNNLRYFRVIFLFYHENICCVYSFESTHCGDCNDYIQLTILLFYRRSGSIFKLSPFVF